MPFPQYSRKHRKRPLFTATEFRRYEARRTRSHVPRAPRSVILVFGRRWQRYLSRKYAGTWDPECEVYRVASGVGVAIVGGPGAPWATIVVEELAAIGTRRFVIVGMAGSLQPDLRVGSLVLCTRALRDEGTSYHYLGPGRFALPSAAVTTALRATLARAGVPFTTGTTWTIDAPYRETKEEVRRYRRAGILTVEMEASAIFAVARVRGGGAAALFVISDHLDETGWEPRFHDSRAGERSALELAVRAMTDGRASAPRPTAPR